MVSVENLKNLKNQTLNKTLLEKFRKLLEKFFLLFAESARMKMKKYLKKNNQVNY